MRTKGEESSGAADRRTFRAGVASDLARRPSAFCDDEELKKSRRRDSAGLNRPEGGLPWEPRERILVVRQPLRIVCATESPSKKRGKDGTFEGCSLPFLGTNQWSHGVPKSLLLGRSFKASSAAPPPPRGERGFSFGRRISRRGSGALFRARLGGSLA